MKNSILAFLSLIFFSSCGSTSFNCDYDGSGKYQTKTFEVFNIMDVNIESTGEVELIQSDSTFVEVTTDDNLMQYFTANANSGILNLKFTKDVCATKVRIKVSSPQFRKIDLNGSAKVMATTSITTDTLYTEIDGSGLLIFPNVVTKGIYADINGSGNIDIKGSTKLINGVISGSGDLNLGELASENAYIGIIGSGNSELSVSKYLNASIEGSGNVYYTGNPQVESQINGSGKVIKR